MIKNTKMSDKPMPTLKPVTHAVEHKALLESARLTLAMRSSDRVKGGEKRTCSLDLLKLL
jgi:hypothetical protein